MRRREKRGILHRIVEHTVQHLLVRTSVGWVAVKNFTGTKDASGSIEVRPK